MKLFKKINNQMTRPSWDLFFILAGIFWLIHAFAWLSKPGFFMLIGGPIGIFAILLQAFLLWRVGFGYIRKIWTIYFVFTSAFIITPLSSMLFNVDPAPSGDFGMVFLPVIVAPIVGFNTIVLLRNEYINGRKILFKKWYLVLLWLSLFTISVMGVMDVINAGLKQQLRNQRVEDANSVEAALKEYDPREIKEINFATKHNQNCIFPNIKFFFPRIWEDPVIDLNEDGCPNKGLMRIRSSLLRALRSDDDDWGFRFRAKSPEVWIDTVYYCDGDMEVRYEKIVDISKRSVENNYCLSEINKIYSNNEEYTMELLPDNAYCKNCKLPIQMIDETAFLIYTDDGVVAVRFPKLLFVSDEVAEDIKRSFIENIDYAVK